MLVAGIVTLVQLYAIGPVGGKVPIIMGTSSGFIGVFNSVAKVMGGGIAGYGAIMLASVLGGLFETVLGFLLKPLRRFFPAVVTGTVVLSIGLSLVSVGVNSFGGGNMEMCIRDRSTVTQVVKSWPGLDKLPTSVVVIVLSLVLCPVTFVALMAWMDREITWYMVFACMIGAFIVALVAMDGWERLKEIWDRTGYREKPMDKS